MHSFVVYSRRQCTIQFCCLQQKAIYYIFLLSTVENNIPYTFAVYNIERNIPYTFILLSTVESNIVTIYFCCLKQKAIYHLLLLSKVESNILHVYTFVVYSRKQYTIQFCCQQKGIYCILCCLNQKAIYQILLLSTVESNIPNSFAVYSRK